MSRPYPSLRISQWWHARLVDFQIVRAGELHLDALHDMQVRLKQRLGALCGNPLQHMSLELDHDGGAS